MTTETNVPELQLASEGKRLVNFIVDLVVVYGLFFLLSFVIPDLAYEESVGQPALVLFMFLYYFLFETFLQKTPAKYITGTKVVLLDGSKPGVGTIALRTLCRLVPFDAISAIGTQKGARTWWHDRWAKTRVVKA
jgi:uncharacterized RDD family membrane protein YckC